MGMRWIGERDASEEDGNVLVGFANALLITLPFWIVVVAVVVWRLV